MWSIILPTCLTSLIVLQIAVNANSFENVRFKRQVDMDNCTTLIGEPGICIPIRECKSMIDLLVLNKNDLLIRQRIRKSHCGFIHKEPKVCCKDRVPDLFQPAIGNTLSFIDLPLPTTQTPLTSSEIDLLTPSNRFSTEISLSTSNIPLTSSEIPLSTSNIPLTSSEIPLSTSNIPLTSSEIPLSTSNIPLTSSEIPLSTSNIPLSSSEIPSSTSTTENISTSESPLTTTELLLSRANISSSELPPSLTITELPLSTLETPLTPDVESPGVSLASPEAPLPTSDISFTSLQVLSSNIPQILSTQSEDKIDLSIFNHLPSECGKSIVDFDRNIAGLAPLNAWPWLALIGFLRDDKTEVDFVCSGFLVTDRHIVTAKHCLSNQPSYYNPMLVRLGEHNTKSTTEGANPIDIDIDRIILSENLNMEKGVSSDIAIIVLKTPVKFTDSIRPICLPFAAEHRFKNYTGATTYIAGWGARDVFSGPSEQLLETRIVVVSNEQCQEANDKIKNKNERLDERSICAGGGKNAACRGDSGNPLMYKENDQIYAIGVVSHGFTECGNKEEYTVYTRVMPYLEWIAKNTV